ncbi:MAG: addiction module toxin RelE [Legionella sp.]|nr:MAG: addiction module toxin RelE [Legionella sp.]
MPSFRRSYKKMHKHQKPFVHQAIQNIIANPKIGEIKRGDLAEVYVYKFKLEHQDMLLAYEWDSTQRLLLALGVHENFYRDLKKQR